MKILYVENHARFSSLVCKKILASHEVVVAPSLEKAKKEITNTTFDLVLLDYDLDDGKGSELVLLLKESENPPKIIAVSSHEKGNIALMEAGANAVCSKSNITSIQSIIESLFR